MHKVSLDFPFAYRLLFSQRNTILDCKIACVRCCGYLSDPIRSYRGSGKLGLTTDPTWVPAASHVLPHTEMRWEELGLDPDKCNLVFCSVLRSSCIYIYPPSSSSLISPCPQFSSHFQPLNPLPLTSTHSHLGKFRLLESSCPQVNTFTPWQIPSTTIAPEHKATEEGPLAENHQ